MNNTLFKLRSKDYLTNLAAHMGAEADINQDGLSAHITLRGISVGVVYLRYIEKTPEQLKMAQEESDIFWNQYGGQVRQYCKERGAHLAKFPKFPFELDFKLDESLPVEIQMELRTNIDRAQKEMLKEKVHKVKRKVIKLPTAS